MHCSLRLTTLAALIAALTSSPVNAATITIDATDGAVYDAIIDGFPMAFANDGTPDAGGNALSVAKKAGVTEMRGIAEFPLAQLGSLTAGDIVSATLTFNVDDVIGSFEARANFDGTASENIFVWAWNGNGTVDLVDFSNVAGAPAGSINTGPHGTITDATLGVSGPVQFQINVTAAVQARVNAASTHIGLTFATNDENTATSIDNLGFSGGGPPGVNGAVMPFLTIVTVDAAPPVFTDDEQKCQQALSTNAAKYAAAAHKLLIACMKKVLKDVGDIEATAEATTYCAARLDPVAVEPSKLAQARAKAVDKILDKCEAPLQPSNINSPCNAAAATMGDVVTCVLDDASTQVQRMIRAAYADGCANLTAVNLNTAYPEVCVVP